MSNLTLGRRQLSRRLCSPEGALQGADSLQVPESLQLCFSHPEFIWDLKPVSTAFCCSLIYLGQFRTLARTSHVSKQKQPLKKQKKPIKLETLLVNRDRSLSASKNQVVAYRKCSYAPWRREEQAVTVRLILNGKAA